MLLTISKKTVLLLIFTFSSLVGIYAQKPISPSTLRIALSGMGWSRLPADSEINAAFSEYKSRLPKHCAIIKNPFKVHGGWYPNDPLMDNKALLVTQCTDSYTKKVSTSVASLKYDYQTGKFKFENVLIPGQRDPSDPKHKEKLVETAYYLHPVDLAPLRNGWTSGGGGRTTPQPKPTPTPTPPIPADDENDGWLTTVIGLVGAGLVAAIIARLRKKKKKSEGTKTDKKKKEEAEAADEEHYIIQYNKKSLKLSEHQSDHLVVTVYKVTVKGGQQLASNAQITLTANDKAIALSKAKGKGKLSTDVVLQGLATTNTVFLTATIVAGQKTAQQSIPVHITQENWHLDVILLPQNKTSIRPDVKDGIYVYARAAVSGKETHPKTDDYTKQIQFKGQTDWLDLGNANFEEGWMKIYIEASNPDTVQNSVAMPKEAVLLVSLHIGDKVLDKRVKIGLLKVELEVDKDRLHFLASKKKQHLSFNAFIQDASQAEEWTFEAKYQDPYGGTAIELSNITMKRKSGVQVEFFLEGPLQLPQAGEKSIESTLVIYAKQQAHEKPLERHITVSVRSEGLFLEHGADEKGQLILLANGKLNKKLELGLYVWDEANKDVTIPQDALKDLFFQLQSEAETAKNVTEVLSPKFSFSDLVYNIPYSRYYIQSEQEIPGTGEYIDAPYLAKATVHGKTYECLIPIKVRTYGIGPDFPEWQEAYDKCLYTIHQHVPYDAQDKLLTMLERRKLTLGAEGLNALRKQIWDIAYNLILAEGDSGYRSVEMWANRITVVLEWAEWMGNIAFNVLAAYFMGTYAPVASISKGVLVNAIICYRENGSADDFFWQQLEQQFWGMFKAAEGRVIDVDRLEKWLGVNKAYAWLIFVSYHFIINLYKTHSVVEALKEAAREARDELLVAWLLGKVRAEGAARGYQTPPKETLETINKVKNAIKKDYAGREYVDKKLVIEIMQDPQKVRTLKNHAPMEVQKAFENTRSAIQKAHDQDLIKWISEKEGIPPHHIKVDDFRTPGTEGFRLNTDRDYRVVVRGGKDANGQDIWIEMPTKKWAEKSHEFFGKHTEKPADISHADWSRKCQQMPTDKHHVEASIDYSDQGVDPETGKPIKVKPNILKVKAGESTLIDPEGLGNMYHEKVNASIRDNNIPEAYAQCKKGVDSLDKVRKGYQKQGYELGKLPDNLKKGMEIIEKAPVDDTATPARLENLQKQLQSLGFKDVNDFSGKMSGQFKNLGNAKKSSGFLSKLLH